jgi:hypothetical protein
MDSFIKHASEFDSVFDSFNTYSHHKANEEQEDE